MIEIVINYDSGKEEFRVYEPTTDTILISKTVTEALVNLSTFLSISGMIQGDILNNSDISYHLDSETMRQMIASNVNLLKRLKTAPSGFTLSSQRFGTTTTQTLPSKNNNSGFSSQNNRDRDKRKYKFSNNNFSGKNGFSASMRKFGSKN